MHPYHAIALSVGMSVGILISTAAMADHPNDPRCKGLVKPQCVRPKQVKSTPGHLPPLEGEGGCATKCESSTAPPPRTPAQKQAQKRECRREEQQIAIWRWCYPNIHD
jgi:hypothetical protein